jgi:hypothetical protein
MAVKVVSLTSRPYFATRKIVSEDIMARERLEGLKNSMNSSGIKPTTFQLVT